VAGVTDGHSLTDDDLSPWRTIWYAPRRTIRWVLDNDPTYDVKMLAALGGIADALGRAVGNSAGDKLPTLALLGIAVAVGAASGLVLLYLFGWIVRWVGTWLGGRVTHEETRAAIAWAYPPSIASVVVLAAQYAIFGDEVFRNYTPTIDDNPVANYTLTALATLLGLWTFALLIVNLSEAQGFTIKRALSNVALAVLVVVVPLVVAGLSIALLL
jgi:hypothetical protein